MLIKIGSTHQDYLTVIPVWEILPTNHKNIFVDLIVIFIAKMWL